MNKQRLAIIGAGDMARQIAHYVANDKRYEVIGFVDDYTPVNSPVGKYSVLSKLDSAETNFKKGLFDLLIVAVGYSRMNYRKLVFDMFDGIIPFATFVHSSCFIDSSVNLSRGVIVFPGCVIDSNVTLGKNVFVHCGSVISHDSKVGSHTYVSPSVSIAGNCVIGESCILGISTTIIDRISICESVRTGGGTVVINNINEAGTYVGVPARKINDK